MNTPVSASTVPRHQSSTCSLLTSRMVPPSVAKILSATSSVPREDHIPVTGSAIAVAGKFQKITELPLKLKKQLPMDRKGLRKLKFRKK